MIRARIGLSNATLLISSALPDQPCKHSRRDTGSKRTSMHSSKPALPKLAELGTQWLGGAVGQGEKPSAPLPLHPRIKLQLAVSAPDSAPHTPVCRGLGPWWAWVRRTPVLQQTLPVHLLSSCARVPQGP